MVLPLIPAVLIAVGAVAGSGGVALGGKGAYDLNKASRELKDAQNRYKRRHAASERRVETANRRLQLLGTQQQQALVAVVVRMGEFLRRNQQQVRESERLLVDGIDAAMEQVPGLGRLDVDAGRWIGGIVGSASAAAGTSMGVSAVATSYGVASTGAAIAGLSGAAAESATLAFLGGGSLAAGGGGMALGAAALNVVMIGPALLVGGFVTKSQGAKAITKAEAYRAKVEVAIAELDETDEKLRAVNARVNELSELLTDLTDRATGALDQLESETFDPQAHAPRFQRAINFAVAVREVATAPILDASSGDLTEQSGSLTVKYRAMTKELHNDE